MKLISCHLLILMFMVLNSTPAVEQPINSMCPVIPDESIEPGLTTIHNGALIGFCCRKCIRRFQQNPTAYQVVTRPGREHQNSISDDTYTGPQEDQHHVVDKIEPNHGNRNKQTQDHAEYENKMEQAHDHGGDGHSHGQSLLAWLGKFHIIAVHFPIGLILVAAPLALLGYLKPTSPTLVTATVLTHIGSASALAATLLGWATWTAASYPDAEAILTWHQWLGTSTAIVTVIASIAAGRTLTQPRRPTVWLISLLIGAVLVGVTGHFGGSLIYGSDYLF